MKGFKYLPDVSTLKLDESACIGCGACTTVCPHSVFAMNEHKVKIIDLDACMECGACQRNCPVKAIRLTPGTGCASFIFKTWIKGKKNASCGPADCC